MQPVDYIPELIQAAGLIVLYFISQRVLRPLRKNMEEINRAVNKVGDDDSGKPRPTLSERIDMLLAKMDATDRKLMDRQDAMAERLEHVESNLAGIKYRLTKVEEQL